MEHIKGQTNKFNQKSKAPIIIFRFKELSVKYFGFINWQRCPSIVRIVKMVNYLHSVSARSGEWPHQ